MQKLPPPMYSAWCKILTNFLCKLRKLSKNAILILVDNKAKWRISKRVFQENKARQIFRKTNISYPLIHCFSYGFFLPFTVQGARSIFPVLFYMLVFSVYVYTFSVACIKYNMHYLLSFSSFP